MRRISTVGPKSCGGGVRLCQTRLIPRSPDGDNNGDDGDAYEFDSADSDAHDDDDGEVRAAAANSPSRASPPALSLANVTKVLMIIISMIVIRWF